MHFPLRVLLLQLDPWTLESENSSVINSIHASSARNTCGRIISTQVTTRHWGGSTPYGGTEDIQTEVEDVQTEVEDTQTEVEDIQTEVEDIQTEISPLGHCCQQTLGQALSGCLGLYGGNFGSSDRLRKHPGFEEARGLGPGMLQDIYIRAPGAHRLP